MAADITEGERRAALNGIRTALDPAISEYDLDWMLEYFASPQDLEESHLDRVDVEDTLRYSDYIYPIENLWPDYYEPEQIKEFLSRWVKYRDPHTPMAYVFFLALNPSVPWEKIRKSSDHLWADGGEVQAGAYFMIESFFQQNPLAGETIDQGFDEAWKFLRDVVPFPMAWILKKYGKGRVPERTMDLAAQWLSASSHEPLRQSAALIEEMRVGVTREHQGTKSPSTLWSKWFNSDLNGPAPFDPRSLARGVILSARDQHKYSGAIFESVIHYIEKYFNSIENVRRMDSNDSFFRWYSLIVPEMKNLSEFSGYPVEPLFSKII